MKNQPTYRPLAVSNATLIAVVNRGQYARFGKEFEAILDRELELRGIGRKGVN